MAFDVLPGILKLSQAMSTKPDSAPARKPYPIGLVFTHNNGDFGATLHRARSLPIG